MKKNTFTTWLLFTSMFSFSIEIYSQNALFLGKSTQAAKVGEGYNSKMQPLQSPFKEVTAKDSSLNSKFEFDFQVVKSNKTLTKLLKTDLQFEARSLTYSGSAKLGVESGMNKSESSINLLLYYKTDNFIRSFVANDVSSIYTEEAKNLSKASFKNRYGNYYASNVHYGKGLFVAISISTYDAEDLKIIEAGVKGGYNSGTFKTNLDVKFKEEFKSAVSESRLSMKADGYGYDPGKIHELNNFLKLATGSIDNFDNVFDVIQNFWNTAYVNSEPIPFMINLKPYPNLPEVQINSSDLDKIWSSYWDFKDRIEVIQSIYKTNTDNNVIIQALNLIQYYEKLIHDLENAHVNCINGDSYIIPIESEAKYIQYKNLNCKSSVIYKKTFSLIEYPNGSGDRTFNLYLFDCHAGKKYNLQIEGTFKKASGLWGYRQTVSPSLKAQLAFLVGDTTLYLNSTEKEIDVPKSNGTYSRNISQHKFATLTVPKNGIITFTIKLNQVRASFINSTPDELEDIRKGDLERIMHENFIVNDFKVTMIEY